ncbi:MAG: hypothetical protein HPM95_12515 [Alphaproteobacteria bacterium]|nr:hypothetical protein [Alphaproteobacteria bacterium]
MSAIEHENVHGTGRILDRFFTVNWVFSAPGSCFPDRVCARRLGRLRHLSAAWLEHDPGLADLGYRSRHAPFLRHLQPHLSRPPGAAGNATAPDRLARRLLVGPLALVLSYGLHGVGASFT